MIWALTACISTGSSLAKPKNELASRSLQTAPTRGSVILALPIKHIGLEFVVTLNGDYVGEFVFQRSGEHVQISRPFITTVFGYRFSPRQGFRSSTRSNLQPPIVATLPIVAESMDYIEIDASELFESQLTGWESSASRLDGRLLAFHLQGITKMTDGFEVWGEQFVTDAVVRGVEDTREFAGEVYPVRTQWSFIFLSKEMQPREYRIDMGFRPANTNRNTENSKLSEPITKWRLEHKAHSESRLSVQTPIRVIVDPGIPNEWVSYVIAGVEEWERAFVHAGFDDAVSIEVATPENAEILLNSGRFVRLRWVPIQDTEQPAMPGSMVDDLRPSRGGVGVSIVHNRITGEIIGGEIRVSWPGDRFVDYFDAVCRPALGDDWSAENDHHIYGEILTSLVSHEMGHIFGLADGNYGEFAFSSKQLRDPNFLNLFGFTPSVMNYSRCNYVAQLEDSILLRQLLPRVSVMDVQHILWGYGGVDDPQRALEMAIEYLGGEAVELTGNADSAIRTSYIPVTQRGPQTFDNAVDTRDPVISSKLALSHLRARSSYLDEALRSGRLSAIAARRGYFRLLEIYSVLLEHPLSLVGGSYETTNPEGVRFVQTEGTASQASALDFVLAHIAKDPDWLIGDNFETTYQSYDVKAQLQALKRRLLRSTLSVPRIERIAQRGQMLGQTRISSIYQYLDAVRLGFTLGSNVSYDTQAIESNIVAFMHRLAEVSGLRNIEPPRFSIGGYHRQSVNNVGISESDPSIRLVLQSYFLSLCTRIQNQDGNKSASDLRRRNEVLASYCRSAN